MSRTTKYKLAYSALAGGCAVAAFTAHLYFRPHIAVMMLIAFALFLPGRIQGLYWRDFFRGGRFLAMGDARSAAVHFSRFMQKLHDRPALRRLIWLSGAIYTQDAEAITLNNLGAARMQQADFAEARTAFENALRRDAEYPIPYFNLAQLAYVTGRTEEAKQYLRRARELGYSQATLDRVIAKSGSALARIEGIGCSVPAQGHCIHCGYDLTGNTSGTCPECGRSVTHDVPPSSP